MLLQHRPATVRLALLCAVITTFSSPLARATSPAVSSPVPERIAAREAWRKAEELCTTKPEYDVVVGRGGSMLPLYPDGTVLLLKRQAPSELQSGMTVVFVGDTGRPVAHALVRRTWRGWVAKGLNNAEADRTLVRPANYLGTVIRAFTPVVTGIELASGGE